MHNFGFDFDWAPANDDDRTPGEVSVVNRLRSGLRKIIGVGVRQNAARAAVRTRYARNAATPPTWRATSSAIRPLPAVGVAG